jgi:membrane-bound lytic murein transglycosylase F
MKLPRIMSRAPEPGASIGSAVNETKSAGSAPLESLRNLALLLLLIPFSGCDSNPGKPVSSLDRVKQSGELRVATRHEPSASGAGASGEVGFEHDLARLFAQRLKVKPTFVAADSPSRAERAIAEGQADIAGGMRMEQRRNPDLRFGPGYRSVTEQVLYGGGLAPRTPGDLRRGALEIAAGSPHSAALKQLRRRHPGLRWRVSFGGNATDLLSRASDGLIDYTVANSDQALLMRRFYPRLRVAFDIGKPRQLAWALPRTEDPSLYNEVVRFFADIQRDKTLDQLIDRYYGHAEAFDAALDNSLRRDFRERLPQFKPLFVSAGERHGLDWRLLAAVSYQESKWKRTAVSAEGVRGMMMLTGNTARELKVRDRFDAAQSIMGGATYLRRTLAAIPPRIPDPDRTWYALAAYNLGPGHVQDARDLVRAAGGDPDKWIEIKRALPLLGKPGWYQKTKFGKARGSVAVHYVNSIRRYYDLLMWLTREQEEEGRRMAMGYEGAGGA